MLLFRQRGSTVVKKSIMKSFVKKMTVSVLALSLAFGLSGSVFAASHAKNGANVLPSNLKWTSFSICTKEDGGEWEDALKKVYRTNSDGSYFLDENGQKVTFVKGVDYATEGWIIGGSKGVNKSSAVNFYCKSTGWDGEYASLYRGGPSTLVADNPWGMTLTMDGIPVELGRYYTMEFDMAGDLKQANYDAINHKTDYEPKDKHILLKAYDYNSSGGPSAAFERVTQDGVEASKDGFVCVNKTEEGQDPTYSHIVAKFKIPDTPEEWGGGKNKGIYTQVGIKFALGANLISYPLEGAMKGNIYIKNMVVKAATQHLVRYYDGKTLKTSKYVNDEESANPVKLKKKGYTLSGFTNMANNKKYNFAAVLTGNLNLRAIWSKTPTPAKASFKVKSKKAKRETVTFGANKNAQGYQVMYSYSSKFKKGSKFKTKTKNTSKTETYTIKSLKSGSVVYVKARAYNLDSQGNKIFGAWSSKKAAYVR